MANANKAEDPTEFEPDGLEPGADDKNGADMASKIMLTTTKKGAWNLRRTRIQMPIGIISGATEEELLITDLITRWMIPRTRRATNLACRCYSRPQIVCMSHPTSFASTFVGTS